MNPPTISEIKAECRKIIELGEAATAAPWESGYSTITTGNIERNSQLDVTENGTYEVGEFFYQVAYVPVMAGDLPTVEGAKNANFICYARSFTPAAARALLVAIEAIEQMYNFGTLEQEDECEKALESIRQQFTTLNDV